jgi:hypothetical protein
LEVHSTGLLIGDLQRWAGPQGARLRSSNIPILETCAASYLQGGIPGVLEGSPPPRGVNKFSFFAVILFEFSRKFSNIINEKSIMSSLSQQKTFLKVEKL